jgi:hypothetical protein
MELVWLVPIAEFTEAYHGCVEVNYAFDNDEKDRRRERVDAMSIKCS